MARRILPRAPYSSPPIKHAAMMQIVDLLLLPPKPAKRRAAEASLTQHVRDMAEDLRTWISPTGLQWLSRRQNVRAS